MGPKQFSLILINFPFKQQYLPEPLDYEEFLSQHMNIINRDPLKHILDFPQEDVNVKTIPRKIRTIDHILPKEHV